MSTLTDLPSPKHWALIKKRTTWLRELQSDALCKLIAIEFTCRLIENMVKLPVEVKQSLLKVHELAISPKKFAAKQMLDDTLRGMDPSYALLLALSSTVGTIIQGRSAVGETAIVSAAVAVAVPWERQIEILHSILAVDKQFGLPAEMDEISVYNDWLEERNLVRLKMPTVLGK
ncbi:MAG: hypothetical protein AB8B55_21435 [Mariniblastus sp.]